MMRKIILLLLLLLGTTDALNIAQKYPSYEYVLSQLDIDKGYIANSDFVNFVTKNENKFRRFYINSTKRGKKIMPIFGDMLAKGGLSHLFIYMSMTESGFKANAKSSKQAAGMWQFMSATAQLYGLKVNRYVDQRYDPLASTNAAMRYIRALYRKFGKWYLVMMAYNAGEGRIARSIKRARSDSFEVLMDPKKQYIPFETRRYLQKIILLSMMGEHIVKSDNREDQKLKKKIIDDKVFVNIYAGTDLMDFVEKLHMRLDKFFDMNPQLHDYIIPKDMFVLQVKIPKELFGRYKAFYKPPTVKEIFAANGYDKLIAHVVKEGDGVKSVAREYGVTPMDLIIINELSSPKLKKGTILMIPTTD